jgi:hypothetical protein
VDEVLEQVRAQLGDADAALAASLAERVRGCWQRRLEIIGLVETAAEDYLE